MEKLLKYPILMVHGLGFRDNDLVCYWGRIPKALEAMGCKVFFGNQDSVAPVSQNGAYLVNRIQEILEKTGADKVNIIAHSKGGLDSRYAISQLGAAPMVASLTTICTPHHGSKTVDKLMELPEWMIRAVAICADIVFRFAGDQHPDAYKVFHTFTTEIAEKFNEDTPDAEGVLYQSYAFVMKRPLSDPILWLSNLVVNKIEGENDGLLPPEAVKWGNFKGIIRGAGNRGLSHLDEIDLRRRPLYRKPGNGITDIVDFYTQIVMELIEAGY
ncbi:MAG: hypothetical protein IJB02_01955 [Oscillospiraceae bacterium]|nr:hypothetical protein [Oscillospiraceae bacterium]